jgi:hypothetical protein
MMSSSSSAGGDFASSLTLAHAIDDMDEAICAPLALLLCGGCVTHTRSSEAASMWRWLQQNHVDLGLNSSDVWLEDASTNTVENALYARYMLELQGALQEPDSRVHLIIVTSDFHLARSALIFTTAFSNLLSRVTFEFHACPSPEEVRQVEVPHEENLDRCVGRRLPWLRTQLQQQPYITESELLSRGSDFLLRVVRQQSAANESIAS